MKKRKRNEMEIRVRFVDELDDKGKIDIHDALAPLYCEWRNKQEGYKKFFVKKSPKSNPLKSAL
jgi:hypothetical protein